MLSNSIVLLLSNDGQGYVTGRIDIYLQYPNGTLG